MPFARIGGILMVFSAAAKKADGSRCGPWRAMNPEVNQPTLLVVDDDPRFSYLGVAAADRTGEFSRIHEAGDGAAALEFLRGALHEGVAEGALFVLSDLSMPRLDGLELIAALKQDPELRGVPIAIMTSSNRPNDREEAIAAGCCAFFYKPENLAQITVMVAAVPGLCAIHLTALAAR